MAESTEIIEELDQVEATENIEPELEPTPAPIINVETIDNTEQLENIENLLDYQVQYIQKLEKEEEEQRKLEEQQALEQEKLEKEQAKELETLEKEELEARTQAQEHAETELEALQMIADNTSLLIGKVETLEAETVAIKEEQLHITTSIVEGFWIVTLTIAVAVAMKLFWSNTLKW